MGTMTKLFALYKGDEFIDFGTARELAERYNYKINTIYWLSTPSNLKRIRERKHTYNALYAIKMEDDDIE